MTLFFFDSVSFNTWGQCWSELVWGEHTISQSDVLTLLVLAMISSLLSMYRHCCNQVWHTAFAKIIEQNVSLDYIPGQSFTDCNVLRICRSKLSPETLTVRSESGHNFVQTCASQFRSEDIATVLVDQTSAYSLANYHLLTLRKCPCRR